ncbi:MAG: DUF881 domain-containing protein [Peptococcaceae bacterium]|jgi:uncharacterized protein YlxW (UPF0749 family)|nr:DUF881 domain-containing protein [Peptococcaceae bacterium]
MKTNPVAILIITMTCMLIGVLFTLHQNLTNPEDSQNSALSERMDNLVSTITDLEREIAAYEGLIEQYRGELAEMDLIHQSAAIQAYQEELKTAQLRAGLTQVVGQGIEITLDDNHNGLRDNPGSDPNNYIIHYDDLLSVVTDLKSSGAEAIAINDQRLIGTSELRCVGNVILVNTTRLAPPFVIQAIGNASILWDTVAHGRYDYLLTNSFPVSMASGDQLVLPAYKGEMQFLHAQLS